jgi:hypothetical protein
VEEFRLWDNFIDPMTSHNGIDRPDVNSEQEGRSVSRS